MGIPYLETSLEEECLLSGIAQSREEGKVLSQYFAFSVKRLNPIGSSMHNVYFVQYIFRATEQAQTSPTICVLVSHLTYTFVHIFVIFKV